jgi:hypothetical protein
VVAPGIEDLLVVLGDYRFDLTKLLSVQAVIVRKFDFGLQPKLGFAISAVGMDVYTWLFSRKEEEPIAGLAKDWGSRSTPLGH